MGLYCINVDNVNEALPAGLRWLANMNGVDEESRNGPVRVSPTPVCTTYAKPMERVLFSPLRDANPFFHLFESLWMLAGRNDVRFPTMFNARFDQFSDDGEIFHGAYGHRWRVAFGYDQIAAVVALLKRDPSTRRAVLQMWDATCNYEGFGQNDLIMADDGLDVPCNTHGYFRINDGALDFTVLCRSNDTLWGAYGANAVHFSILQEYVAAHVGVPVGQFYQFSHNFHYYGNTVGDYIKAMNLARDAEAHNLYETKLLRPMPLIADPSNWDLSLPLFLDYAEHGVTVAPTFTEPFFAHVAMPMIWAWRAHKAKEYKLADDYARQIVADDWRVTCIAWLERRAMKLRDKLSA